MSEDPIGFIAGDMNLYRYVRNNPSNYKDPSGNSGITGIFDGVGGIFAGNPGAVIGGVIGGGIGGIIGGVPGAILGGIIGDQIGDALWPIESEDPNADKPKHPNHGITPVDPSLLPPIIPPLTPPNQPNTCPSSGGGGAQWVG